MKEKTIEYARKWFEANDYNFEQDGEQSLLYINDNIFVLDESDVAYRAELYLESELEGVEVD